MLNIYLRVRTKSGLPVRNIREEKKSCNCNLSSSFTVSGEILINNYWHRTKWNLNGINNSGVSDWNLENY